MSSSDGDDRTKREILAEETTQNIEVYMKALAKHPILTKKQEVFLANQLKKGKEKLIDICLEHDASLNELYFLLRDSGSSNLRKLFSYQIEGSVPKEEIRIWSQEVIALVMEKIAKKPVTKKLKNKLYQMKFTLEDLKLIYTSLRQVSGADVDTRIDRALDMASSAKNQIVECNLRLVFSRAKRFVGKGLTLEELIQEGNLGLVNAVEKFDPKKGNKFSTYATWWIEQAFSRAMADKSRLIRIPVHMVEDIN